MPKAKSTSKKSSRKMTIYRKPRDMDIFKPVTTKLVYTDTILLSSTGSVAFNTHTFRANSVFDPDWTGAGHQPTRFDQLAALYQRYEVLKSKSESSLPQVNLKIHRQRSHWDLGMSVSFVADKHPSRNRNGSRLHPRRVPTIGPWSTL